MIGVKLVKDTFEDVEKVRTGKKKDIFKIKPVKAKDISGAGLTLATGYLFGPFIPFNRLKNYRFPMKKSKGDYINKAK